MLVQFILRMTSTSHHLSFRLLRLKVAELTQDQGMPFKMGFMVFCGWSGFGKRNSTLSLCVAWGLEIICARGLYLENVKSLYENFCIAYYLHNYFPNEIWNCDESCVQAGRSIGVVVLGLHSMVNTNERTYVFRSEINNTRTSNNHNWIRRDPIFNPIFAYVSLYNC